MQTGQRYIWLCGNEVAVKTKIDDISKKNIFDSASDL
jgi:hypothetical protein